MSDPILELLAAPPSPSMRVDEDAVHAGGRRRVRRRALRRTAVGLGVLGATAIAFAALGTGADRGALPAGPSPSVGAAGRVSAEVLDGRYAVEVVPGAPPGTPNVVFYSVKDGRRQQLAGSDATPDVVSMGTGSGAEGIMLGTAPADATSFLTVHRSGAVGFESDQQPLPGTDFQAVAVDFDLPRGHGGYLDTIWLDGTGAVRHANGETIPSVVVPSIDDPATEERLFVSRPLGQLMGVIGESGGSYRSLEYTGITHLGYGDTSENGSWSWRSVTLLPAGARDVRVDWSFEDWVAPVVLHPLPDGTGTLAVSEVSSPEVPPSAARPVASVTWTDEAGTRHTDPVE